ncbi:charged multivesicular body protein 4c isoform X1 [Phlebotomus papatasi]|uniref:charged multivesicular body protein 4c isoform X1 n=1 Tax=Phlebotomus papatasi TaxID=29031 RepID=UPI0024846F0E|nr:charged multivesicular body protein 4c isoform X1 [Phlebotomus papatasi]
MSFFGKMFGKKGEQAPTTGEAIQKLRETENMLIKKQEFLESKIEAELDIARKNGSKNKRVAIQALKRKKKYEKQLQQIDGTLSTIEMQREALESANTNTAVLTTMKNAADALKAAHNNMDVDQIHDMMDDIAEQQNIATEISDAISNPVSFGQDIDEDELEKELEELEQEELDKELLGVGPSATELPEVPSDEIKEKAKEKKKGLYSQCNILSRNYLWSLCMTHALKTRFLQQLRPPIRMTKTSKS